MSDGKAVELWQGQMAHTYRADKATYALPGTDEMSWRDPAPDIIATIREMTFRVALAKSKPSNSSQFQETMMGTGEQTVVVAVYESHYVYLGVALGIVVLTVAAILPLFGK
ncbi:hypothetical protein B0T16DRAFT_461841 [Cercophora newfieldiana]|uniref:Uncharacterized protein n=1 Tax=Cercophora newfieldiana TaxID=92897 RepID=A0AA40CKJ9_9PEZI|nr:hypothetical protein B0T16DRAFT_461841 [Cercophora newfieldiana]